MDRMQFLTQGSLFIFAQTNGIVDRTGGHFVRGHFVRNLSCDKTVISRPASGPKEVVLN